MKFYSTVGIVVLSGVLVVAFNNCSNVSFTPMDSVTDPSLSGDPTNPPGGPDVPTPDVVVISKKCDSTENSAERFSISFPEPAQFCDWGVSGNLQTKNGYFQARREQEVDVVLPKGATICDIKFNFSAQSFYFDDHITLALNDRVLASSFKWDNLLKKDSQGLLVYDWQRIVGQKWTSSNQTEGVFCAGKDENLASCSWPATQTKGTIKMDFNKSVIQKVMAASSTVDKHVFKFITTGDDDTQLDCKHSAIQFTVDVKYVK